MDPKNEPSHEPGRDVPRAMADKEPPEQVGASHGEATGAWRVLLISTGVAVAVLLLIGLFYWA
jgi:hypothetical protein